MQFIFKLQCSWKLSRKFCFHLKNAIQNRGHSIYLCLWKGKLFPVKMILCVTFSLGLSFDIRVFSMLNKLSVNGWRLFILCIYMLSKHMTYFSGWIYILGILVIEIIRNCYFFEHIDMLLRYTDLRYFATYEVVHGCGKTFVSKIEISLCILQSRFLDNIKHSQFYPHCRKSFQVSFWKRFSNSTQSWM